MINLPPFIAQFVVENPTLSLILVYILGVIITTEIWRGLKWLLKVVFKSLFNKPREVSPKQQTIDKTYRPHNYDKPSEVKYIKNEDNYLEVKK